MSVVDWAVARRPLRGQSAIGDGFVACDFSGGTLLAAIDGLGHGIEAAAVARRAEDVLERNCTRDLPWLFDACHRELRGSRGVVAALASVRDGKLTWASVGDVAGVLWPTDPARRRAHVPQRGGVLGEILPRVVVGELEIEPGDTLVLATDGVQSAFADAARRGSVRDLADGLLEDFGKATDDALVLVARYRGDSA